MLSRLISMIFPRPRFIRSTFAVLTTVAVGILVLEAASSQQPADSQRQAWQTSNQNPQDHPGPAEITQVPGKSNLQATPEKNTPELSSQDVDTVFKVRVNLVEVLAVVRDAKGRLVKGLKKEDFQLLDDGKPQAIQRFAVEDAGAPPLIRRDQEVTKTSETSVPAPPVVILPQHYVAYVFDDIHLKFDSLALARMAALRHLETLRPSDRAGIFTTSGQTHADFTDDRAALRDALNRLAPRPVASTMISECPHMSYYMADRIENRGDSEALDAAAFDAFDCAFQGKTHGDAPENMARNVARNIVHLNDYQGRIALDALRGIVQRLALMPGRRTMVLVSPGFLNINQFHEQLQVVERALHAGVVIDTLDARGLYTMGDDASVKLPPRRPGLRWKFVDSYSVDGIYRRYAEQEKTAQADVLMGLALDTGGTFFHNSNDLLAGFETGTPTYSYLLAFSPANLKLDGRFHHLTVTVGGKGYSVQARRGYFAPKELEDAAAQARGEIEDAVFSQQESHEIPVQLNTEFFKVNDEDAKLSVLVRVDARSLHFRKVDGRNHNDVTVVSALFDRNGKFVAGTEKILQMRLKDETVGSALLAALTLKSSFDVKTGSYLVRLVVRDEGGRLTAENNPVDIP